jgi:plastocyanin
MRRVLAPLLLLAAAALVAAGCGGSDNSGGGGGTSSSAAPAAPADTTTTASGSGSASESESGKSTEVRLQNIAFSPKTIRVKTGTEIEWENYDTVAHNVVAQGGASFKSPTLEKGDKFKFTPTKAGTISYVCTFHPGMTAQIDVTQ